MWSAHQSEVIAVTEESQVGEARRCAAALARRLEFSETDAGRLAIIVTEAARNLARHAQDGVVALRLLEDEGECGVEVLTLDRGPGIPDVSRSLRDGFSTGGTSGTGLGALRRLADSFDIFSQPERGTAVLARCLVAKDAIESRQASTPFLTGALNVAATGEEVCGDSWACAQNPGRFVCMVCDGLGHGPQAAEASREARRIFYKCADDTPARILEDAHAALRSTRGAAMAVAEIDEGRGEVRFCGIGNISATLCTFQHSGIRSLEFT